MRYLIYKSTDLLDNILFGSKEKCIYVRLTDKDLKSGLFNRLIMWARKYRIFLPLILKQLHAFRTLSQITSGDHVIIFDIADIVFVKYLRLCLPPSIIFHTFYWNPLDKIFGNNTLLAIEQLKSMGCIISTFDMKDAANYHLVYKKQFIRKLHFEESILYDYYFLGYDKNRKATILTIINSLNILGQKGQYFILNSKDEQISYHDNIRNVMRSRIIIEVVQEGQHGITLRALEALVYGKKLITNCHDIKQYDFYRPENILIWGDENDRLKQFIQSDAIPPNPNLIEKYSVETWLSSY